MAVSENNDPKTGKIIWHKVPISTLVGKRKAGLINWLLSYYFSETRRKFDSSKMPYQVLRDRKEIKGLFLFCIQKAGSVKDNTPLFRSLVSLSELYSIAGSHRNSVLFLRASYYYARSSTQKNMIRAKLIDATQKLVSALISVSKARAVRSIVGHINFIVLMHKHGLSSEDLNGILSLILSADIGHAVIKKLIYSSKNRKKPVMRSVIRAIKQVVGESR